MSSAMRGEFLVNAMKKELQAQIEETLKTRLLAEAEKIIQPVVEEAVKGLEIQIEHYFQQDTMRDVVNLLVQKKIQL